MPQRLRRIVLYGVLLITFLIGVKMGFDRLFKLAYYAKPVAIVKTDKPISPTAAPVPTIATTTIAKPYWSRTDYNPFTFLKGVDQKEFSPYLFYSGSLSPEYIDQTKLPPVSKTTDETLQSSTTDNSSSSWASIFLAEAVTIDVPSIALKQPLKLGMTAKVFDRSKGIYECSLSSVTYSHDAEESYVELHFSSARARGAIAILAANKEDLDKWTEATASDYTEITDSKTLSGYRALFIDLFTQYPSTLNNYAPIHVDGITQQTTLAELMDYLKRTLNVKAYHLNTSGGKMIIVNGLIKDWPSFSAAIKDGRIEKFMPVHSIERIIKFGNELCFIESTWEWNSDGISRYIVLGDPFSKEVVWLNWE